MLEIAEDSAGIQASEDFSIEFAFARMYKVMNREAGDDGIEVPEFGQRFAQVMLDYLHERIGRESVTQTVEHRRGEIESDGFGLWAVSENQRE